MRRYTLLSGDRQGYSLWGYRLAALAISVGFWLLIFVLIKALGA